MQITTNATLALVAFAGLALAVPPFAGKRHGDGNAPAWNSPSSLTPRYPLQPPSSLLSVPTYTLMGSQGKPGGGQHMPEQRAEEVAELDADCQGQGKEKGKGDGESGEGGKGKDGDGDEDGDKDKGKDKDGEGKGDKGKGKDENPGLGKPHSEEPRPPADTLPGKSPTNPTSPPNHVPTQEPVRAGAKGADAAVWVEGAAAALAAVAAVVFLI
ncbi:hypothetical protein AAE478_007037 [Parahypoxylon ruwenzoriense]